MIGSGLGGRIRRGSPRGLRRRTSNDCQDKQEEKQNWGMGSAKPFTKETHVPGRKQSIRLVLHSGSDGDRADRSERREQKDSSIPADQARESCHFAFLIR